MEGISEATNEFQYFNCIGGIEALLAGVALNEFQYFNCIGGIHQISGFVKT